MYTLFDIFFKTYNFKCIPIAIYRRIIILKLFKLSEGELLAEDVSMSRLYEWTLMRDILGDLWMYSC